MTLRTPTRGECLCGTVRYEADGPLSITFHCHCSICRKHHGSAFATFVAAPLMGFRWLSGQEHIDRYPSSEKGERPFCRTCGAVTPTLLKDMDLAFLPAGNLPGDLDVRPQAHLFVGSKASWYPITDSLPQHEEYPPEYGIRGVSSEPREVRAGVVSGTCLCGDIAYEVSAPALAMRHCHCSRCRRGRSAAHATNLGYRIPDFRFTRGAQQVADYRVPEAKFFGVAFCRRCGGAAPRISQERGFVIVPAGTLDCDPGIRPTDHIFVGSKANWFEITDGLPQFQEHAS
jgi:hypothetical protein